MPADGNDLELPEYLKNHESINVDDDHLKRLIKEAFELFDHDGNGTVQPEELGTIMRYLGVFPSEKSVVESVLPEILGDEQFVRYEKFEPKMMEYMKSRKWEPDSADILWKAFKVLDVEGRGYIEADRMRELLTTEGIPFRDKEADGFMNNFTDGETNRVYYEQFAEALTKQVKQTAPNLS